METIGQPDFTPGLLALNMGVRNGEHAGERSVFIAPEWS